MSVAVAHPVAETHSVAETSVSEAHSWVDSFEIRGGEGYVSYYLLATYIICAKVKTSRHVF